MYRLLSSVGVDFISRSIFGKNKSLIISYHNPSYKIFETHMKYLNEHYRFISLSELVAAINNNDKKSLQNTIVVTFDDGHKGNFELLPIIRKYNIKPTIYLCTSVVANQTKYWWSGIDKKIVESLKLVKNRHRLQSLSELDDYSNVLYNESLSKIEIQEMMSDVFFGNHTCNHPIVTNLDDNELISEIIDAKSELDYLYELDHFAFPNGDYSNRELKFLRSNKFKSARTIDIGYTSIDSDVMKLKIAGISDSASLDKLKVQISCLFGWVLYLIKFKNFHGKKKY